MPDPQIPLQEATYLALTVPPLLLNGTAVPVGDGVAPSSKEMRPDGVYVLLSQWTTTPAGKATACQFWDATVLIDVIAPSRVQGKVNQLPALQVAAQIVERLEGQRIGVAQGWRMQPIDTILNTTAIDDTNKETVDVHRYLRFRFHLDYQQGNNTLPWTNPAPPIPAGRSYRRVSLPPS
jgi:uncharacterized membrane protein